MKTKEKGIKLESDIFFATPSNQSKKLFFYVTCTGHFYYEDNYLLQRDNYHSFLIMHIVKGSARVRYNNLSFIVKSGHTVLINCHIPHFYESLGDLEIIWFHFEGLNSLDIYNELNDLYEGQIIRKDCYDIIHGIEKIYNIYKMGKKATEAIQSSYIARILASFFINLDSDNYEKTLLIDEIVLFIEEHYKEDLSIRMLAQKASLSEFYFSRVFKKVTGYTIYEYIIKTRVNNAKTMLKLTNLSLKEIAYSCGFSNESSFSSTFKKKTNMTPGEFRNTKL